MTAKRTLSLILGAMLVASWASAQSNTGKVAGRVTAAGEGLPGVRITASSAALQGIRAVLSSGAGDYVLPQLPAGDYELTYELDGFSSVRKKVKVNVDQTLTVDQSLQLSDVSEEIVVTGEVETISREITTQTTFEKDQFEKLALTQNIDQTVRLAPGVHSSGPRILTKDDDEAAAISIAGAMTTESLYMVNGVVVNENLRGQPIEFVIEDAVQETTISTSGISAEYGRFAGGVVNVITKSGGNQFHGSGRVDVDKESWEGRNPLTPENQDNTQNETYSATVGGRILRDKLWFFVAARDADAGGTDVLNLTNTQIENPTMKDRQEYKLTVSPTASHRLVGTFSERNASEVGDNFSAADLSAVNDSRQDPEDLTAVNYTGILSDNFFLEAQYSERNLTIGKGAGAKTRERVGGTWILDLTTFSFIASPAFCAVCVDQERNNENSLLKASYFLSSQDAGSHDIVFGFDTFDDILVAENHQSGSDFSVWAAQPFIVRGSEVYPQVQANGANQLWWNPIFNPTQGTQFTTDALFVNDTWRLGDKWSFNVGLRYNENDSVDSGGAKVSDDTNLSPRLGASYDLRGDGDWVLNASVANYSHSLSVSGNTGGGAATAGALADFIWNYNGPDINPDRNAANLLTSDQAVQVIFDWFAGVGDIDNTADRILASIPGVGTQIRGSLITPNSNELAIGVTKRLGTKGVARADYVWREFHDFYIQRTDTGTGQVQNPDGSFSDLTLITNDDSVLERQYSGIHTQLAYRFNDRIQLGANYSLSHAYGNFDGETSGNGGISSEDLEYPEIRAFDGALSGGDLQVDQRHKAAAWVIYTPLATEHHTLSLSLLQRYNSGSPFLATADKPPGSVASSSYVDLASLGYLEADPVVDYWFYERGDFVSDDVSSTEIAANYSFDFDIGGKSFEVFLQPEILNLFNNDAVVFPDSSIQDATTSSAFQPFNPFTESPVEGVHYALGPNFGQALSANDYQRPRIFRFSVGFRF